MNINIFIFCEINLYMKFKNKLNKIIINQSGFHIIYNIYFKY